MPKVDKRMLRTEIRAKLKNTDSDWLRQANAALLLNLKTLIKERPGQVLAWYPFFYAEPDLLGLQSDLGRQFYFPRVNAATGLDFYCSRHFVADGMSGLMQPEAQESCRLQEQGAEEIVCLVPALAFDRHGNRLGRGAGMYDRFLTRMRKERSLFAIGVCWSFQLLPMVETEPHDQRVDALVTESEVVLI